MNSPKVYWFYIAVLIISSSRGWLELAFSKQLAYVVQAFFLVAFAVSVFALVTISRESYKGFSLCLAITLFLGGLSLVLSLVGSSSFPLSPVVVLGMNLTNLIFLIYALVLIGLGVVDRRVYEIGLTSIALVVVISSYLQFFGVVDFPGDARFEDFSRLSGSFGSKQHLSIVLSILSFLTYLTAVKVSGVWAWVRFFVIFFTLLIALTRSGYFIFFAASAPAIMLSSVLLLRNKYMEAFKKGFYALIVLSVIFFSMPSKYIDVLIGRAQSFNFEDRSQNLRGSAWEKGIEQYSENGTYLISAEMGTASQIPSRLFNNRTPHYESGILQYLINFGAIFLFWVFLLFLLWAYKMKSIDYFFFPLAYFCSLIFYMSNEIIPSYVFFPLISLHYNVYKNA